MGKASPFTWHKPLCADKSDQRFSAQMSIKVRVILLLGLLLLAFAATFFGVRWLEHRTEAKLLEADRINRTDSVRHWVEVDARELREIVVSSADAIVRGSLKPGDDAVRRDVERALVEHHLAGIWVIGADAVVSFQVGLLVAPPAEPADLVLMPRSVNERVFFAVHEGRLIEVCTVRLEVAGSPSQTVAVARIWDQAQLQKLSALMDAQIELLRPPDPAVVALPRGVLTILYPLADWRGTPVRFLRVDFPLTEMVAAEATQTRMFFLFGVLVLLAMAIALELWVLRPLRRIGESLATSNPDVVAPLSAERTELGRVAQLVQVSFQQKAALEQEVTVRRRTQAALEKSDGDLRRTMEDRARLGRDLHDGVIQSLYAAGMGLTGIRALLDPEQTEAAARLEQTRATLNETIHDVRNFIVGLEPEALRTQTFEQAVRALVEAMQVVKPVRSQVSIDNQLAARLTLAQRVHALQIAREAMSNAMRHGHAEHVSITLRAEGHFAAFEVIDDGSGFDVGASGPGRGLANFVERARELGAELTVTSAPGQGAAVKLIFAFLST